MISSPGRLLLVTRSGAVYASPNNGSSWTAVGAIGTSDLSSAARLDAHVLALGQTAAVYRSADDGATWSLGARSPLRTRSRSSRTRGAST